MLVNYYHYYPFTFRLHKYFVTIFQLGLGIFQSYEIGPTSWITSRWCDHVNWIAYGVPMPAPRGSPEGPNQWFYGAPVVRARKPAYVTPLTVMPRSFSLNRMSFETIPAVRLAGMLSNTSTTFSNSLLPYSVTTWNGPKTSVVSSFYFFDPRKCFSGTQMAVGSQDPY